MEIEGQKDTLTVSNIYRSPNNPEDKHENLNNFIDNLATKTSSKILIVGDFNYRNVGDLRKVRKRILCYVQ